MFGKRGDGVRVKDLQIIDRAMPYFMPQRIDAVNLYEHTIDCATIDNFILEEKKNSGVHYTYTELMMAAAVRMLYERPKTNRFINNCMVYQRKYISVSISVKKKLSDDGEEVTLKLHFTGRESIAEIKKKLDDELQRTCGNEAETHETTKFAGMLAKMPNWLYKFALCCIRFSDKHNMLPRSLIDVSPFHTSIYIADLRSIKLDALFHHLYNFGNTTIFATMGKMKKLPMLNKEGEVEAKKCMTFKFSLDERVCDGLYYSNSLKLLMKYIENPALLKESLPMPEMTKKERKIYEKEQKREAKKIKKQKKQEKKAA